MTVMRSVFYIPGNNLKFIEKAPVTPADIITLDLEDSVPPDEKVKAREITRENPEAGRIRGIDGLRPGQQLGDVDDQRRS